MKVAWCVPVLCVFVCTSSARADLPAPPGFKYRELRVVIDNLGDYPDRDFYLIPASWVTPGEPEHGPGRPEYPGPMRVQPDKPFLPGYAARFSHDWTLVAVPRGRIKSDGPVDWKELTASTPDVLHSNRVQLHDHDTVSVLDPRDYETHHFRISLTGAQLTLTPGAVERGSAGFRSWLPGVVLAVAIVGLGGLVVWLVRRARRRAQVPTATP